jgi:hypothetical protein
MNRYVIAVAGLTFASLTLGPLHVLATDLDMDSPGLLAQASARANFSGTWVLDLDASDSFAPLLESYGVGPAQRRLVDNTQVTQVISQSERALTITVKTPYNTRTEEILLDGTPQSQQGQLGSYTATSRWSEDGSMIVSEAVLNGQNGESANFTMRRFLEDNMMIQQMQLQFQDGRIYSVDRVFRKG